MWKIRNPSHHEKWFARRRIDRPVWKSTSLKVNCLKSEPIMRLMYQEKKE
jgi:hypothetical protein